jgi:hypothetical protein
MKRFFIEIYIVARTLFLVLAPFVVCASPMIPAIIYNNGLWMWLLIITMPVGVALFEVTKDKL